MLEPGTTKLTTASNMELPEGLSKLYGYLLDRGALVAIEDFDPKVLPIFSQEVFRRLKARDPSWEAMVPEAVAEIIKRRGLFGQTPRG
jgi:hypothetical protein